MYILVSWEDWIHVSDYQITDCFLKSLLNLFCINIFFFIHLLTPSALSPVEDSSTTKKKIKKILNSNCYIFATKYFQPLIFYAINSVRSCSQTLKYQSFAFKFSKKNLNVFYRSPNRTLMCRFAFFVCSRNCNISIYSGDHCLNSLFNWCLTILTVFMKPAKCRPKLNFPGEVFIKFIFPQHWRVPKYWKIYFVITFWLLKVSTKFPLRLVWTQSWNK